MIVADTIYLSESVVVLKLNGRAREGLNGRHRRLVVYASADVTNGETIRLLREAADRLERTLPRELA